MGRWKGRWTQRGLWEPEPSLSSQDYLGSMDVFRSHVSTSLASLAESKIGVRRAGGTDPVVPCM